MELTVLMPARNAGFTIERAVASLDAPSITSIVLIDDFSDDDTVARARKLGDVRLRVVRPNQHRGLAHARNRGLEAVETEWLVWCDADDAFEPGRAAALLKILETTGADCASDGVRLFDGPSGRFLRDLPVPEFLGRPEDACRLFERNYLPGVGHIAVRTGLARELLYDDSLSSADDYDLALRLVRAGARFAFSSNLGYRMHAYPGSDSRKLERQNAMTAQVLRKHAYEDVADLYRRAGFSERVAAWGLSSMAIFRREYAEALRFLDRACPDKAALDDVLEPEGPYPVPEGWRHAFSRGTLHLLLGDAEPAGRYLTEAGNWRESADACNNLGVALARVGRNSEAHRQFERALELFPGYLDARLNLQSPEPSRITPLPLRLQPSRNDYLPESA
ncbi:MAG: glycosyltransferase [Acidobacteriota bacterium]